MKELPIIQKAYDLIKWYEPILNRLPRDRKYIIGDRMISGLFDLLNGLILNNLKQSQIQFKLRQHIFQSNPI